MRKKTLAILSAACIFICVFFFTRVGNTGCVFPDNPSQPAPDWVCSDLSPESLKVFGYPYLSTGDAKKSKVGVSYTREMAIFQAKSLLAAQIRTVATRSVSRYLAVTGIDEEAIDKFVEIVETQFSHAVLDNVPVLATAISDNGHYYVLIGMNKKSGGKIVQKELENSFKNNSAQYQKELGREAFKKLEKRIKEAEKNPEIMSENYYEGNSYSEYLQDPKTGELVKIVTKDERNRLKDEAAKE